ncbi:hypothetical protein GGR57DRAFT_453076 [Xylariaceae sp. FL1272]|nr:hypothetical protein GGR57DRAFT_453076 [Xylariaceae sp. FL1272]
MLLTSSQVSVLITTTIVILCTSALFFSGYVIQQRTLRDLRTAIKPKYIPRPKPHIYAFDAALTDPESLIPSENKAQVALGTSNPGSDSRSELEDGITIEVRPSIQEPEQKPKAAPSPAQKGEESQYDTPELKKRISDKQWDGVQEGGEPLTRLERRKRIKDEIQRLSQGEPVYYQRRLW